LGWAMTSCEDSRRKILLEVRACVRDDESSACVRGW
jgi:hypothetical protein